MSEPEPIPKICSVNNLKTFRFDYQLAIDNYASRTQIFDSENFAPPGIQEPKFYLKCNPNINNPNTGLYDIKVDLYLQDKFQNKSAVYVTSRYSVIDENGQKFQTKNANINIQTYGALGQIQKNTIPSNLIFDGKLTILIEFTMQIPQNSAKFEFTKETSEENLDQKQRIVDDLDKMLQSGKFSDFVLQLGDKKLRVHKNILAARSPYFAAKFTGDFEERKTNKMEITDGDSELFEEMIRFLYTSKIPSIDKNAAEFLALADKYQLDSLKSICEDELFAQLDADTMVDTFLLSDTYNAEELKAKTIEYISTRPSAQDFVKALLTNKNIRLFEAMKDYEKEKK